MEIKAKCGVCNSRKMCIEERAEDFLPTSFMCFRCGFMSNATFVDDNENYKKIDIAKLVQSNFFPKINMEIIDKDKDLRSYRLDFSKMKKFFNLESGSNLLNATKIITDNINSKKYGDLESKKYYNT